MAIRAESKSVLSLARSAKARYPAKHPPLRSAYCRQTTSTSFVSSQGQSSSNARLELQRSDFCSHNSLTMTIKQPDRGWQVVRAAQAPSQQAQPPRAPRLPAGRTWSAEAAGSETKQAAAEPGTAQPATTEPGPIKQTPAGWRAWAVKGTTRPG